MSDVRHLVLTRSSYNPRMRLVVKGEPLVRDADYFSRRFQLFRDVTCASLAAQTNLDFEWVVMLSPLDPHLDDKLELLRGMPFKTHATMRELKEGQVLGDVKDDGLWRDSVRSITVGRKLTTRIDDDDALAGDFIERLRPQTHDTETTAYIFPFGHILQHHGATLKQSCTNQFCSLLTMGGDDSTVMSAKHGDISRVANRTVVVDIDPAWLWVRHGDSKSVGGRHAVRMGVDDIRNTYQINWGALCLE